MKAKRKLRDKKLDAVPFGEAKDAMEVAHAEGVLHAVEEIKKEVMEKERMGLFECTEKLEAEAAEIIAENE